MKVYLASRYDLKPFMTEYAEELKSFGISVTASWLNEPHKPESTMADIGEVAITRYAEADIRDIFESDVMVFFSEDPLTPVVRGGRHVEFGYALGLRMPIIVVGPRENIFHYLSGVTHCETWYAAKKSLLEIRREYNAVQSEVR